MISIITAIKDIERARQITSVLVRHGFGELVQRMGLSALLPRIGRNDEAQQETADGKSTLPVRLRLALQDLGPSFIKLGQIASTRPDIIPADIVVELKMLLEEANPLPFEVVRDMVEGSLGGTLDELFVFFDPVPLASASIAQVHRAKILDEEGKVIEVVVKAQRPGLRHIIERDLDLLYIFARFVKRTIPEANIYSPVGLVREFDHSIMAELDFNAEADNAETFIRNFEGNAIVRFPRPFRKFCTRKVLTQEFFDGQNVIKAVEEGGYSGEFVVRHSLKVIAQMIYEDGFFHADPHPGNLMAMGPKDAPIIGVIDLGLVGRLNERLRESIVDLMVAAVRNDSDALADALLALGNPRGRVDKEAFRAEVGRRAGRYLNKSIQDIQISALIRDLVQGAIKFNIEMPTDLLMMGKALMTIEGVGRQLYPELDIYTELRPYFLKLVWKRYRPQRVARDMLQTMGHLKDMASSLPVQLSTILEDIRSGQLEVLSIDPNLPLVAERHSRRVYAGLVVAGLLFSGALLLASGNQDFLGWLFISAAFIGIVSHLFSDRKPTRRP